MNIRSIACLLLIGGSILLSTPQRIEAVSLGHIDVASHLGERFFAEIPLKLDEGESLSAVFVDLASPIEYRFLEVYRDATVSDIRTAIKQDQRGLRVELSSTNPLNAPYINLILRVRQGRATHFKKYPVFLSLPDSATPKEILSPHSIPTSRGKENPSTKNMTAEAASMQSKVEKEPAFKPFSGWARTARYGPMVYGDTLMTVARRLRIDERYTLNQVAIALFNKNRDKFGHDNINLVKEGSFLDTPTASEVEALSRTEADLAVRTQMDNWRKLIRQQRRYARLAEAQKHRYTKRVRVGSRAEGVRHVAAPTATTPADNTPKVTPLAEKTAPKETATAPAATPVPNAAQQRIAQLKADNDLLQATVTATNKRLAKLEAKLAAVATAPKEDARVKKLELKLMRIQRELARERANNQSDLLMWLLYGAVAIIVLLIVAIGILVRRQPAHPAQAEADATRVAPLLSQVDPTALSTTGNEAVSDTETKGGKVAQTTTEPEEEAPITEDGSGGDPTEPESDEALPQEGEEEEEEDIDHLAQADIYVRYGMEDEAEKQVELALQRNPDDPAAHAKLIEVRRIRGDSAGEDTAKATARSTLSGAALATFEQMIAAAGQADSDDHGMAEEVSTEAATAAPDPAPSSPTEEGARDQNNTPDEPEEKTATEIKTSDVDALLDLQNDPADDDDILQSLLMETDNSTDEDEDSDVLDLSDSTNDDELNALLSSLESDDAEKEASPKAVETIEETSSGPEPATESTPEKEERDTEGEGTPDELSFDLSDIDLSRAKVEEPAVNTAAVEDDNDLTFDTSGLDLGDITLPGAASAQQGSSETTEQTDEKRENEISLPADSATDEPPSATDLADTPEKEHKAPDHAPQSSVEKETAANDNGEAGLELSLEMDDLDALLAGGNAPTNSDETTATGNNDEQGKNVSMDDELGALLSGLDDLDLGNGEKK